MNNKPLVPSCTKEVIEYATRLVDAGEHDELLSLAKAVVELNKENKILIEALKQCQHLHTKKCMLCGKVNCKPNCPRELALNPSN